MPVRRRRALCALMLSVCAPAPGAAHELYLEGSLGRLAPNDTGLNLSQATRPATLRWVHPRLAEATFAAGAARVTTVASLDEELGARVTVRSARAISLRTSSPFYAEAAPSTPLAVVAGGDPLRVELPDELPFRTALVGPEVDPIERPAGDEHEGCVPVALWAAPRLEGPMLVTRGERYRAYGSTEHPGWYTVLLGSSGTLVRGYTFSPPACGRDTGVGRAGHGARSEASWTEEFWLEPSIVLRPRVGRGWRIETTARTRVARRERPEGSEFMLALDGGSIVTFAGVIEPREGR